MTSPPTPTLGGVYTNEGSATISDAAGNLLFSSDGMAIYDRFNNVMANGGSLLGGYASSSQSAFIVKQPGSSNIYYVFTQGANLYGLGYSVVDMNLAAGLGSVTALNIGLQGGTSEKLVATKHCNGSDIWIITHDYSGSVFRSFLINALGIFPFAVTSNVGAFYSGSDFVGILKVSPNSKTLATSLYGPSAGFEIYDFDAATGVVSNARTITVPNGPSAYSLEFSPDGTKLYGGTFGGTMVWQWNLCAGTTQAILSSQTTVYFGAGGKGQMQLGIDGKIYLACQSATNLAVINNPNALGAACNFVDGAQPLSASGCTSTIGMPNLMTNSPPPVTPPFTYTVNYPVLGCLTASFNMPPIPPTVFASCTSASGYSVVSMLWSFADPSSGAANTSTLQNPSHTFSTYGIYPVQLIINYSCGGGSATLLGNVDVSALCVNYTTSAVTCSTVGSATATAAYGVGPFSYTWMPSGQTSSIATGLFPNTYTITIYDFGNNATYTAPAVISSNTLYTGTVSNTPSMTCFGATTGTAAITIGGGSGSSSYFWTNGLTSQTTALAVNLGVGAYSVTVSDAVTFCSQMQTFTITQPPQLSITTSITSSTICASDSFSLNAQAFGGVPAYSYTWANGPTTATWSTSQLISGTHIYSVTGRDANNCTVNGTIGFSIVPLPNLSAANVSVCPGQVGTLLATGANSYTWNSIYLSPNFSDLPLSNTQYTVIGSALGCSTAATASIVIKPIPVVTITQNSVVCENTPFLFTASGGTAYVWSGPQSFVATTQNNAISSSQLNQAGPYQVTVTAANSCTASAISVLTVSPLPLITIAQSASSLCLNAGAISLSANGSASQYTWSPPQGLSSINTQTTSASPSVTTVYMMTGAVSGCTNTASVTVYVTLPQLPSAAVSSNTICSNAYNGSPTSVTLTAWGGGTVFSIAVPPFISSSNPTGPIAELNILPNWPGSVPATATVYATDGVCTTSLAVTISVTPNPVVTIQTPSVAVCAGIGHIFVASGASQYSWSAQNPTEVIYPSGNMVVVSPPVNALYSVLGSYMGCYSQGTTASLIVKALPQVTFNPVAICVGYSVQLVAQSNGTSFTWTPTSSVNNANLQTVIATPTITQVFEVVASLNSCTRSAVGTITVLPIPVPVVAASSTGVCVGENILLSGTGGSTYLWEGPHGLQYPHKDLLLQITALNIGGDYTLTASNAKCKTSTIETISVFDLPRGYLSPTIKDGCVPFCTDLRFIPLNGTAPITETSWIAGGQTYTGSVFNRCFDAPGSYTLAGYITNSNNCRNLVVAKIDARQRPITDFTFAPEHPLQMFEDAVFTSASSDDVVAWTWYFVNNEGAQSTLQHPAYAFPDAGTFPVALVVKNQWGCSDTAVKTITVLEDLTVYVPEAFTPNGDGLNDIFIPKGTGLKNYTLSVFNRWGQLMFISKEGQKMGWDGTYKGEPAKNDVYTWTIELLGTREQVKTMSGVVTLYR